MHEVIKSQLKNLGIEKYLMEDVSYADYGDIELAKTELAFVYEVYYEYDGFCVCKNDCSKLEVHQGNTVKNSYNDMTDNVKTFTYKGVKMFSDSFHFTGDAKNPFLKFILVTILEIKTESTR